MFINSSDSANGGIFANTAGALNSTSNTVQNPIDMLPNVLSSANTSFSSIAAINTAFNLVQDPSAMSAFTSAMQTTQMASGLQNFFSPFGAQPGMGNMMNPMQNSFNPLQQDDSEMSAEDAEYDGGEIDEDAAAEDMEE